MRCLKHIWFSFFNFIFMKMNHVNGKWSPNTNFGYYFSAQQKHIWEILFAYYKKTINEIDILKTCLQEQIQLKYTEYNKFVCTSVCVRVSVGYYFVLHICTFVIPSLSPFFSLFRSRDECLHQCVCVFVWVYVWVSMFWRVWAGTSESYIRPFLLLSLFNFYYILNCHDFHHYIFG